MKHIRYFFDFIASYILVALTFIGGFLMVGFFFLVLCPLIFIQWLDVDWRISIVLGIIVLIPAFLVVGLLLSPILLIFS